MSIYIRKAKDGFVRGSYKYNQNMCSLDCIHMLVFCFNQYAIHWQCSGQSENWNWHKNLCFNYNVSTRYVLHIATRKIKQHQRILPINCRDLLCENVQHAWHSITHSNQQTIRKIGSPTQKYQFWIVFGFVRCIVFSGWVWWVLNV